MENSLQHIIITLPIQTTSKQVFPQNVYYCKFSSEFFCFYTFYFIITWSAELKNSLIMRTEWEFFSLFSSQQQREREDTHLEGGTPRFTSQFFLNLSEGIWATFPPQASGSHWGLE